MLFNEFINGKYKHFTTLLAFFIVLFWFNYLEKTIVPKYIMSSRIDSYIPFIKEFVIPYYLWYPYIVFGFWYLGITSKEDFYKIYAFLFIGMSIACIIYMLFPNAQHLRPNIKSNDILSRLIKNIYALDTPTNVCPSIHVINTLGIHVGLANSNKFKNNKAAKLLSLIAAVFICASTVFIKQHSIIDVGVGIIISLILYLCIYKFSKVFIHTYDVIKDEELKYM